MTNELETLDTQASQGCLTRRHFLERAAASAMSTAGAASVGCPRTKMQRECC